MKKNILIIFAFLLNISNLTAQDLDRLHNLAESGDAVAQYDLAVHYLNSEQTNYIEVLRLLREASKKGNSDAKELVKYLCKSGHEGWGDFFFYNEYDDGKLSEETKKRLEKLVTEGCGAASCKGHSGFLVVLAHSYFYEEKYDKAVYYCKQALSKMKEGNLGYYTTDLEFNIDFAWLDACKVLGYCYEHGYGVEKNDKMALDYYSIGGYPLEENYNTDGIKSILNEINNKELFERIKSEWGLGLYADTGTRGTYQLAKIHMLYAKLGFQKSKEEYFKVIEKDLKSLPGWSYLHCAPDMLWFGEIFYKGIGVSADYSKAYNVFYHIVHELDEYTSEIYPDVYADASYRLYECYALGRGVEKNSSKAEMYFKQALKYGSSSAIYDDQKHYEITKD